MIHAIVVVLASTLPIDGDRLRQNLIPVGLVELPDVQQEAAQFQDEKKINHLKQPPAPPKPQVKKLENTESMATKTLKQPEAPQLTSPLNDQAVKSSESHTALPADPVLPNSAAEADVGGSETGAGNLQADLGVVSGTGTGEGRRNSAASGLNPGRGVTGLPTSTTPFRINREAKPLQTVRASYPRMALRMGVEGDVTLQIEIDSEGKVTKADVIESGGAAFDQEAIKAVKQARFEPASKDGRNVPAEFTYVYRFRLRK